MTVTNVTIRRALLLAVLALPLAGGCKSKETDGTVARGRTDPLLAGPGRIAPQNLPIPDRGTAGNRRGDPLLGAPTSRPNNERSGYTEDPERFRGIYVPSASSVPAALSSRLREGEELKIERPGGVEATPVRPASGMLPTASIPAEAQLIALETHGVRRGDYSLEQENGGYVLRVRKELQTGAVRQYTETGNTASEAIRKMIEQLKSDQ
jgi:hypothetical protein